MGRDVWRCELDTNAITGPYQEGDVGCDEEESICVGGYGGYLQVLQESEDRLGQKKLGASNFRVLCCADASQEASMKLCLHWSFLRSIYVPHVRSLRTVGKI
ncbi:hypothetical protein R1flu_028324 [Riccia fluitans]|uniref:Uncharacterized protein n=1 Tax=Riccia fluitans TaxID=41844 RepID=A0ABD1XP72_9MARC